jgi:hypothetical protein
MGNSLAVGWARTGRQINAQAQPSASVQAQENRTTKVDRQDHFWFGKLVW